MKKIFKSLFVYLKRYVAVGSDINDVKQLIRKIRPRGFTDVNLVRIGPNSDGGYLVPDFLNGIEALFSPGVDVKSEFEVTCFTNYSMRLFLADASVDMPKISPDIPYHFEKKFLGAYNTEEYFTLDSWVGEHLDMSICKDLMLQMDIEGAEYCVLLNMSERLQSKFRIIIVEFHGLQNIWENNFRQNFDSVLSKLLLTHEIVHLHPNNSTDLDSRFGVEIPCMMEFTFYRKDCIKGDPTNVIIPHRFDYDCVSNRQRISLPLFWLND